MSTPAARAARMARVMSDCDYREVCLSPVTRGGTGIASERGQRTLRSGPPERRAFSHLSCQLFLCAGFRPPAIDVALVDHLALVIEPDRSEIAPRRSLIEGLLDYPVDFFPYNVWVGGELGLYSLARGVV